MLELSNEVAEKPRMSTSNGKVAGALNEQSGLYTYVPLKPRYMRLLLACRDATSRLRCGFLHVPLDNLPVPYQAVSYTWGNPTRVASIACGKNTRLEITASVKAILELLVDSRKKAGYIWIDALCIDQSNREERAQQVRLMQDVFLAADHVIVWLGKSTKSSDLAMPFISTVADALRHLESTHQPVTPENLQSVTGRDSASVEWAALASFLERPWFEGIWVVQEIVYAHRPRVICGNFQVDWNILAEVVDKIVDGNCEVCITKHTKYQAKPYGFGTTQLIKGFRTFDATSRTFEKLLRKFRDFKATDGRDKVFALVGLASDGFHVAFRPDYEASLETVLMKVAKHLLVDNQSLFALHAAGLGRQLPAADLPSWVADWACPISYGSLPPSSSKLSYYKSAGTSHANVRLTSRSDTISIDGVILDLTASASEITWAIPRDDVTFQDIEHRVGMSRWLSETLGVVTSLNPYPTGEEDYDVFWRTIIANTNGSDLPAPSSYEETFEAFVHLNIDLTTSFELPDPKTLTLGRHFGTWFEITMMQKRFFATPGGYVGVGPRCIESGDVICIFLGAQTPFVLEKMLALKAINKLIP